MKHDTFKRYVCYFLILFGADVKGHKKKNDY